MVIKYRPGRKEIRCAGGLTGFICKKISDFELSFSECISSELTTSNNAWLCFSIYKPPGPSNLSICFEEISVSESKAISKYQNIIQDGRFQYRFKN